MAYTNFKIIQGDTWSLEVTYTDAEDTPINISNFQVVAEVRDKPGGPLICGISSTQNGGIVNVDNGHYDTIKVTFTGEQTAKFILPKSYYQIKVVDTADTLLNGWVELEPGNI
jgi:hypothetical protein